MTPGDPADSPPARAEHAMAFDAGLEEIVLFGGSGGEGALLEDTWAWDGASWLALDPLPRSPPARLAHAMATQDPTCGVLLFGGEDENRGQLGDTWLFNGGEWILLRSIREPPPRRDHALAYDQGRERTVLSGGSDGTGMVADDTWEHEPSRILDIAFHEDVPLTVAGSILNDLGATVLQPGVIIQGVPFNAWQAAVPRSLITALAGQDTVIHVQPAGIPAALNDGSRIATGVSGGTGSPLPMGLSPADSAPWCGGGGCTGSGVLLALWDPGWAAGDAGAVPPVLTAPLANCSASGQTIGAHAALRGRVTVRDPAMPVPGGPGNSFCFGCDSPPCICRFEGHATHVAGTMIGDGTGNLAMTGMAPGAALLTYETPTSVGQFVCELVDSLGQGARAANNSWGWTLALFGGKPCSALSLYDLWSMWLDRYLQTFPTEALVFAAGNEQRCRLLTGGILVTGQCGTRCSLPPIFEGGVCSIFGRPVPPAAVLDRFYTLAPGLGQVAKNTLVVGAVSSGAPSAPGSLGRMTTFSSWGPTQDGRIKPDLVAPGAEDNIRDGSSAIPTPASPRPVARRSRRPTSAPAWGAPMRP